MLLNETDANLGLVSDANLDIFFVANSADVVEDVDIREVLLFVFLVDFDTRFEQSLPIFISQSL